MGDRLLDANCCERCGESLEGKGRMMSWFTEETICANGENNCSAKESEIKRKLREQGKSSHEGCGFIPIVENSARFAVEK